MQCRSCIRAAVGRRTFSAAPGILSTALRASAASTSTPRSTLASTSRAGPTYSPYLTARRSYSTSTSTEPQSPAASSSSSSAEAAAPLEKPDFLDEAESTVWDMLVKEFEPKELVVQDISGGCGSMYGIEISSEKFRGANMLKQQRMVNAVLGDLMKSWHGVQLKTRVP